MDDNDEREYLERIKISCDSNNYGCASNFCWVTCGPRFKSNDWCVVAPPDYVTKNNKNNESNTLTLVSCKTDSDCDPCWKCADVC